MAKKLTTTKPAIPAPSQSGTAELAAFKMSQLVVRAIEDGMGDTTRTTSKSEREMALFAVYKLQDMVASFRKRFLTCWSIGARTRKAARS